MLALCFLTILIPLFLSNNSSLIHLLRVSLLLILNLCANLRSGFLFYLIYVAFFSLFTLLRGFKCSLLFFDLGAGMNLDLEVVS